MALAPLTPSDGLYLKQAPNGGWLVGQMSPDLRNEDMLLGAYTDADAMLDDLRNALRPDRDDK